MKFLVTLITLFTATTTFAAAAVATSSLTADFLHGFETGLLIREDKHALDDYNCEVPVAEDGFLKTILGMVAPV